MNHIVFFRIGWMKNYKGRNNSDPITNGGSWPDKGEVFNFASFKGQFYGYVQPSRDSGINLPRIEAGMYADKLTGTTVVWIANRPGGGSFIVGWYQNATVYAECQPAPSSAARDYGTGNIGFYAKAKVSDCTLLELDERQFEVPRGKGYPGRSNVFYADANPQFAVDVLKYIATGKLPKGKKGNEKGARQHDPLKRIEVEKAAIKAVETHYKSLGYKIESVEREKVGWDLTASAGRLQLHLEVKGLSGSTIVAELTPNEYGYLSKNDSNYRLCIVVDALTSPNLHIFSFEPETSTWTDKVGQVLVIEKRTGARVTLG